MSHLRHALLAALAAFAYSGAPTDLRGEDQEAKKDHVPFGHIAVIEPEAVLKEHQRYRANLMDLRKDEMAMKANLERRRKEVAKLQRRLTALGDESELSAALAAEVDRKKQELQVTERQFADELKARRIKLDQGVWAEISQHAKVFAEKHGIVLVLGWRDPDEVTTNMSADDARALFATDVLYHDNIDITNEVIRALQPPRHFRP